MIINRCISEKVKGLLNDSSRFDHDDQELCKMFFYSDLDLPLLLKFPLMFAAHRTYLWAV